MLKLKSHCVTLNRYIVNETIYKLLLNRQVHKTALRLQSTTASTTSTTDENLKTSSTSEWKNAKPYEAIPTISGLTFLKNFLPGGKFYKLDTTQLMEALKDYLGNISRMSGFFGLPDTVLTHNVQDFEKVLRNEGIWPHRPGSEALHYHRSVQRGDFFKGTEGLLATQGEVWGSFRSAVNPVLMNPKNVRLYLHKMSQVNKEFIGRIKEIRDPQTLEVPATFEEELNRWTLESVSVVALDKQLGLITTNRHNPKAKELFDALNDFFIYSADIVFKPPIWKFYKTPNFKKLMKALDSITDITSGYVNEAIERLEEDQKNGVVEKPDNEKSVFEKLVKIDKKVATVMAMDMLMAGVDTTSSTFTALLLCLAKNPEKQSKLREEVMQLLPQKDSEFDETCLKTLPYLRACIKESMRMYPLIVGNARLPVRDVVLSGYQVPKGTQVSMVTTSLMHDSEHYPRANEYLPERWLRAAKETKETAECPHSLKSSSPFLFLPFGFGARSCVGRRIVEMEMELGIARMIRNFHIEFNHPTENAFKSLLISVPNIPLKFKFTDVE